MEHVKELLSEYIDDKLTDADRRKVDSHLFACQDCRLELDELKAVTKMVGHLRSRPLPAGFMDRLERRRRQEERAGIVPAWLAYAMQTRWMRPASVVLCAMVVMVVAFDRMNRIVLEHRGAATEKVVSTGARDEKSLEESNKGQPLAKAWSDATTPATEEVAKSRRLDRLQASEGTSGAGGSAFESRSLGQLIVPSPTLRKAAAAAESRPTSTPTNTFGRASKASPPVMNFDSSAQPAAAAAPAAGYINGPSANLKDLSSNDRMTSAEVISSGDAENAASLRGAEEQTYRRRAMEKKSLERVRENEQEAAAPYPAAAPLSSTSGADQDKQSPAPPAEPAQAHIRKVDPTCAVAGCSDTICMDKAKLDQNPFATTCDWEDYFECFHHVDCIVDPSTKHCGWARTDGFASCLKSHGAPSSIIDQNSPPSAP